VILTTLTRTGSLGPVRFPYSHYGWVSLRPSDSDYIGQNWMAGTGEIPLLSLWLGVIEAQWFWLHWPELEAWDRLDSLTLTMVRCHWGPVLARTGNPGPVRFPYSFQMITRGLLGAWITHHSAIDKPSSHTGEHVKIKWSGTTRTWTRDHLILGRTSLLNHRSPRSERLSTQCHTILKNSKCLTRSRRWRVILIAT
jgi:hypothetical protein